jgi:DNA repair protein RadD
MITLRPRQEQFEEDIRDAYRHGARRVLGVAPTGFGKTVVFSDMTAKSTARGKSVGIVAHRAEILDQIGKALGGFGVPHGFLAPGMAPNPMASAQVCSVQAMARRIERYMANPFNFLIIDEAHHAAAGSAFHAVINAHDKSRVLGVTATPQRLSGEPLSVAFDHMVLGPTVAELIAEGSLSRYRAFAPTRPDMSGVGKRGGDYIKGETETVMDRPSITGDAVQHYFRLTPGKRAIAFCVSVAHAEHVASEFRRAGVAAASLDGGMDRNERRAVLAAFSAGSTPILTSCEIVSEGFDVPAIEVAILLRPTESLALYLQQVGRALRVFPGKEFAWILDHAGNIARHGFPDDPRDWKLEGVSASKRAGQKTTPTCTCGKCFAIFPPAPACPYCGWTRDINGREVAYVDGVLEEINPDLVREARRQEQEDINRRVRQTRTVPGLAHLAIALGRDAGWIWNVHKARGNPDFGYGDAVKAIAKARKELQDESA